MTLATTDRMTKATKNSLLGSKDDKRAQAQKRKQEEQAEAAAEARENPILPRIEGDKECTPGGTAVIELKSPVELDRLKEYTESTSAKRGKSHFGKKEKTKIVTLAKIQLNDASTTSNKPILPSVWKAMGDEERRPDGTEVIELNSPVELDRLKEWPDSPQQAAGRKKGRFSRKEKTENVKVVVRNGI